MLGEGSSAQLTDNLFNVVLPFPLRINRDLERLIGINQHHCDPVYVYSGNSMALEK